MMPPCGTFDYVAVVPDSAPEYPAPWAVTFRHPVSPAAIDRLARDRLVGHSPTLRITDAGLTPDASTHPSSPFTRPRVFRSLITLTAAGRRNATVSAVSFHVAQTLISTLRPRDVVHLTRTACCGLGLSVIRSDRLIAAAGAVNAVPLGNGVEVRVPADLVREIETVLKRRDPDFEYEDLFRELPIELRVGSRSRLRYRGRFELGDYEVYVGHGFCPGLPGKDMCVAISLKGACSVVAANASAQLLDLDGLAMDEW